MNAPLKLASSDAPAYAIAERAPTGRDLILHADNLNAMLTVAKVMALSKQAVPKHLRGNEGACLAVTMQAMRWNMDPFALAQKTYTVDPEAPIAYEGQAIIAALNNSPLLATRLAFSWDGQWERIVGRFKEVESRKKDKDGQPLLDAKGQPKKYIVPAWDFERDEEGLKVTVSATLVGETAPRVLELMMKQARTRNSPLWTEDPKQQLAYLAGRRWGRLHAPDVIMGVYTPDELQEFESPKDMGAADVVTVPPELMKRAQTAADGGVASYQVFWKGATNLERAQLNELSKEHDRLKEDAIAADKKRTVDNGAHAATPAPSPAPSPAPTAASQADQTTGETTPPGTAEGEFKPTFANVLDMMVKAKDRIAVEIAAEWIPEIEEKFHTELNAKRDECLAKFPE